MFTTSVEIGSVGSRDNFSLSSLTATIHQPAGQAATDDLMSYKRSFLNSVNDGRRRRHSTSIEDLNRTLEELEDRVGLLPRGRREAEEVPHWRTEDLDGDGV
jgi:hypothetical protein